jgi:hypothetical protein
LFIKLQAMQTTKKTGLELNDDLHRRLKMAAATKGMKLKEITELAFEAWLAAQEGSEKTNKKSGADKNSVPKSIVEEYPEMFSRLEALLPLLDNDDIGFVHQILEYLAVKVVSKEAQVETLQENRTHKSRTTGAVPGAYRQVLERFGLVPAKEKLARRKQYFEHDRPKNMRELAEINERLDSGFYSSIGGGEPVGPGKDVLVTRQLEGSDDVHAGRGIPGPGGESHGAEDDTKTSGGNDVEAPRRSKQHKRA